MKTRIAVAALLAGVAFGCKKAEEPPLYADAGGDAGSLPQGLGIGVACASGPECRPGLDCASNGTCQPAHSQGNGQACAISAECSEASYCEPAGLSCVDPITQEEHGPCKSNDDCVVPGAPATIADQCVPIGPRCRKAGDGAEGAECATDAQCGGGLFCDHGTGFTGVCAQGGEADLGAACQKTADCQPGLVCGSGDVCSNPYDAYLAIGTGQWPVAACEPEPAAGKAVAYFEVPEASGAPTHDFYRLPFPNDIRAGHATVGHPAPGKAVLDFDPVQRMLDAANAMDGFGTTATTFFRFSQPVNFETINTDNDQGKLTPATNLFVVNIDPASPGYRSLRGFSWQAGDSAGKYVCQNWLSVWPGWDNPYDAGTTFAVVLRKGVKVRDSDQAFQPDADFVAMLSSAPPAEGRMAAAWEKYAKLRTWLQDEGLSATDLLDAAVFTVGRPTALMAGARDAVRARPAPTISEVTLCDAGVTSPCADPAEPARACGAADPAFYEIHGKVRLPIFQEGEPPYTTPGEGGIAAPGGAPQVVREEDVCFAITLPKGAMPAGGWPLVIYSHGTGGSFRSHVADGTGALVAQAGAATIGIDGAQHGPRRHATASPEALFYNFANPAAAVGNVLQGAIDGFSLVALAEGLDANLGTGGPVHFDATHLAFIGHSQGATTGPLFVAFEPRIGAVVLSGAGAGLIESLRNKTSPVNIPAGVRFALAESSAPGTQHPVLSLVQQVFDAADPLNYAPLLTQQPPEGVTAHHLLVLYGQGDTFTPPATTRVLVDRLDLPVLEPAVDTGDGQPFAGITPVAGPLSGNVNVQGASVTAANAHHVPNGYDGHFVLFRNEGARAQVKTFLTTWLTTGTPRIEAAQ